MRPPGRLDLVAAGTWGRAAAGPWPAAMGLPALWIRHARDHIHRTFKNSISPAVIAASSCRWGDQRLENTPSVPPAPGQHSIIPSTQRVASMTMDKDIIKLLKA